MLIVANRGLETLQLNRRHSLFCATVNLNEMVMCLEDLINYFAQPEDDMGNFKYLFSFLYFTDTIVGIYLSQYLLALCSSLVKNIESVNLFKLFV